MATSRLSNTALTFTSDGTDINARLTATDDIITFFGTGATNNEIILRNLKDPALAQDAATKAYVDGIAGSGVSWKNAAIATDANANVDISSAPASLDGVTLTSGDRILLRNQTTGSQNGLWVFNGTGSALTRPDDFPTGGEAAGAAVFVTNGTAAYSDKAYVCTTDSPATIDTTSLTFTVMSTVPAVQVAGSDTQIQYNDSDALGAVESFTFNKSTSAPTLGVGSDNTSTSAIINAGTGTSITSSTVNLGAGTTGNTSSTINMGDGTGASTIDAQGTGLFTIQTSGAFTSTAAIGSAVNLFNTTTTGNISTGSALTSGTYTIGNTTATGTITINNAGALALGANSTDVDLGSSNATTTNVDGVSVDVGSTSTTSLDLLATGVSGAIAITAGDVTGSGTVSISTTTATTATVAGGEIDLTAGNGATTGAGGAIDINAGSGGSTDGSVGGAVTINSGTSTATNGDGGDVIITAAEATGTGTDGSLNFVVGGVSALWPVGDAAGTSYILTKSNGTAQMVWSEPGAASMLALPEDQLYIGQSGSTATTSGTSFTADQSTIAATPTLNISGTGNTETSTSATINLGTVSANATTAGSINIGKGATASSINFDSTGTNLITSDGALTMNSTSADLTLQAATSGNVVIDTATNDWTFNATTLSSAGAATVSSTSADLTLQAATSGNVVVDTATNDWTFNATTLSSAGAATVQSTSADLTLSTSTSGNIVIDAADQSGTPAEATGSILEIAAQTFTDTSGTANDFMSFSTIAAPTLSGANTTTDSATLYLAGGPAAAGGGTITNSWAIYVDDATGAGNVFIGGDLTVGGSFTQPLATDQLLVGDVSGNAEASGADFTFVASGADNTLNIGTSTANENGTLVLANAGGTGTSRITMNGDAIVMDGEGAATVSLFATPTGTIDIGSSSAGALTLNNGAAMTLAANSTSVAIGSSNATTTNLNGVSVDVGSTSTTSLDLLATGVSGAIAITAGDVTGSGTVSISTTTATTATVAGGEIDLTAGGGATTGAGGAIDINAGAGGATGTGGAVTIDAGAGGSTSGSGGAVSITAGTAATSGAGGAITITAGSAAGTDQNGADITLTAGTATGAGTAGNVVAKLSEAAGSSLFKVVDSANANQFTVDSDGAGTFTGECSAVAFNATSDVRYKTDIENLSDPLSTLKKIEGYSYHWKKDFKGYNDKLQYGVLAQQLEEAGLHHLVAGTEESKSVNYLGLIPLLIEAVKNLSEKVEKYEKPSRDRKGW